MADMFKCKDCASTWLLIELNPKITNLYGRLRPGMTMPNGQCPDDCCRGFCYPDNTAQEQKVKKVRSALMLISILKNI